MNNGNASPTAMDLSDLASRLGYTMHYARTGYEFRSRSGAGDFSVKNLANAKKMLDLIGRAEPAQKVVHHISSIQEPEASPPARHP